MINYFEEKLIQRVRVISINKNGLILSLKANIKSTIQMLDTAHLFSYLTFFSNLDLTTLLTHLKSGDKYDKFFLWVSLKLGLKNGVKKVATFLYRFYANWHFLKVSFMYFTILLSISDKTKKKYISPYCNISLTAILLPCK